MSFQGLRGKSAAFWTMIQDSCDVEVPMRRQLRIRVAFAPTRLAGEHLQAAYAQVVPVARRSMRRGQERTCSTAQADVSTRSMRRRAGS
jgi:hypothetical protein